MTHGTAVFPRKNDNPLNAVYWDEFDYICPAIDLLCSEAFLPRSPDTIKALLDLGASMTVPGAAPEADSSIPAPYTYLGQFIDHDVPIYTRPSLALISNR